MPSSIPTRCARSRGAGTRSATTRGATRSGARSTARRRPTTSAAAPRRSRSWSCARGFRPPGGALDAAGERALAQLGFAYASPEGDEPVAGDVVRMPFRWPLVDAYWVLPNYAERRESAGHEEGAENFVAEVERAIAAGGYVPLIMHPFLWADPATERADREVLDRVASAGAQRMGDAAESVR